MNNQEWIKLEDQEPEQGQLVILNYEAPTDYGRGPIMRRQHVHAWDTEAKRHIEANGKNCFWMLLPALPKEVK